MKTVDVIVPVHNHAYWLAACLKLLKEDVVQCVENIYVIDDRSRAVEAELIKNICAKYAKVKYIENESSNGGFGYACNLGASKSSADLIVFLNTDCFVPAGVFEKLRDSFEIEEKLAMVCPVSNNSPDLTLPMESGLSYLDMAELVSSFGDGLSRSNLREACTIVGNCLMVSRAFFESVGGFSEEWGVGYGEETDLQMKALAKGLLGMVRLDAYVYHFGGGTFNFNADIENHRRKNHALFMGKWAKEYKALNSRANSSVLVEELRRHVAKCTPKVKEYDVIFYLPGIKQGVGGIHAVVALCNELILEGLRCTIALVGISSADGLEDFKEPLLFSPLYYASVNDFLNDGYIFPKIVFSTIWNSAEIVKQFCSKKKAKHIQFVQGYEPYFENGSNYKLAADSLRSSLDIVTTSQWLSQMISRHVVTGMNVTRLSLYVNKSIFFSNKESNLEKRDYDVCLIFRSSADKGQWLAREVLDRCVVDEGLKLLVLAADPYYNDILSQNLNLTVERLPMSQQDIAYRYRQSKVYVDLSMHEGFGLMALEAGLCGCRLVVSDSGGVRDYISDSNGELISQSTNPRLYIDAIRRQLNYQSSSVTHENSIENWVKYLLPILDESKNKNAQELELAKSRLQFAEKLVSRECIKEKINIFRRERVIIIAYKVYKKFSIYLPARIHLAIRALIMGR